MFFFGSLTVGRRPGDVADGSGSGHALVVESPASIMSVDAVFEGGALVIFFGEESDKDEFEADFEPSEDFVLASKKDERRLILFFVDAMACVVNPCQGTKRRYTKSPRPNRMVTFRMK